MEWWHTTFKRAQIRIKEHYGISTMLELDDEQYSLCQFEVLCAFCVRKICCGVVWWVSK